MKMSNQAFNSASFKAASIQKFPLDSLVVLKNNKPWFSLDPRKVLVGVGIVRYYAPETGYQVEVQDETMWYSEDALESAEKSSFDLQAFIKGQKALTRSGCTAKFLQVNKENLVYQVKAEVEYKDGTKTLQDYSKFGAVNVGVKGDLDLVCMLDENKVETMKTNLQDNLKPKNHLKVIMNKETETSSERDGFLLHGSAGLIQPVEKSKVELELEAAIAEEARENTIKVNAERYDWLAKYLTSAVQIDFVDLQLKMTTNKQEFNATIDKLKTQIKFKG